MCANAKAIDLVALLIKADDRFLVDVIAGDNLKVFKPFQLISEAQGEIYGHPVEWEDSA